MDCFEELFEKFFYVLLILSISFNSFIYLVVPKGADFVNLYFRLRIPERWLLMIALN